MGWFFVWKRNSLYLTSWKGSLESLHWQTWPFQTIRKWIIDPSEISSRCIINFGFSLSRTIMYLPKCTCRCIDYDEKTCSLCMDHLALFQRVTIPSPWWWVAVWILISFICVYLVFWVLLILCMYVVSCCYEFI